MGQFGIGQAVRRKEDARLVTGHGEYTDDISLPGQAYGVFLRSSHAHAKITGIDIEAARSAPGVLAVLTAEDVKAAGVTTVPCKIPLKNRDGSSMTLPDRPPLADGVVRYVGDPIAMVIAESPEAGKDAAELIDVEYEDLPASVDLGHSLDSDAAVVWPGNGGNLAFDWDIGDGANVDQLIAEAAHVVEVELVNNRVVANSMEPRGAIGSIDEKGRYVLHVSCQGVHNLQSVLAEDVFKVDPSQIRVICPDVGGGFGMKIFLYPEHVMVMIAAKAAGRPVKWIGERSESLLSDTHGRDHITKTTLALDADYRFLAFRAEVVANLGAYLSQYGPFIPTGAGATMYAAVYDFKGVHFASKGVYTHTTPVDAYRGAGRPEATYAVERTVDAAARKLGVDPGELRMKNFIKPEQMPYTTALGATYDSGEFGANLNEAYQMADVAGFEGRKAESARNGKLRGLGIAYYIEQCGGGGTTEWAELRLSPQGRVQLKIGTQSNGQGHATAYAQVIEERLGIPFDQIDMIQGDTDLQANGGGTGGSRSLPAGGPAVNLAADQIVEKAKAQAADELEVAPQDLLFEDGRFTVAGTDRSVGLLDLAGKLNDALEGEGVFKNPANTFPNGAHVVEVEVDADTGVTQVVRYTIVDDFGVLLNPMLVTGQIHGGVMQGLGQALLEHAVYDESGQLLSGSFMDYAMPRADHMSCDIDLKFRQVPCTTNPLGLKGCGEAGAIGAPPAVINAIVDALSSVYGVTEIDMPATPHSVWQAIQQHAVAQAAE
ncbi:xanthine dehydrogenase family protein molybdopterin-binding subunit [Marinivivus vitaminiproducens]|uniref:xanthine dehydrogenase family protein molybdopterin-binding subunit n=1 Tax=Marinivivus vitaminiproducens TaxID=3035935 RepID=UPI0027A32EF3|nr:xanthine dehydrogenase family protein molybdopterin-binding subunit [Geminicoccaceae bacterium SCSIO 64248]